MKFASGATAAAAFTMTGNDCFGEKRPSIGQLARQIKIDGISFEELCVLQ